ELEVLCLKCSLNSCEVEFVTKSVGGDQLVGIENNWSFLQDHKDLGRAGPSCKIDRLIRQNNARRISLLALYQKFPVIAVFAKKTSNRLAHVNRASMSI